MWCHFLLAWRVLFQRVSKAQVRLELDASGDLFAIEGLLALTSAARAFNLAVRSPSQEPGRPPSCRLSLGLARFLQLFLDASMVLG